MKYKVGDRVRIKSLDWYNENKDKNGHIKCRTATFDANMQIYCGSITTIYTVDEMGYDLDVDWGQNVWTDEMIEGLVEEETKPEPKFKVGDKIISDVFSTKDDKGWKVIDVERTGYKLISVNNPDLICDMDFKNEHYYKLVEEKCDYVQADNISDVIQATTSSACSHNGFYGYSDSEGNETSEWHLPEGYQFVDENGNVINATKIFLEKKKKEYPKTFEECCKILGFLNVDLCFNADYRSFDASKEQWKRLGLMNQFYQLLICRDAYWKIAGEEMGLDKPWEPDWEDEHQEKYIIGSWLGTIQALEENFVSHPLAFPTAEMRDAFYENFKEEIEKCKEFL